MGETWDKTKNNAEEMKNNMKAGATEMKADAERKGAEMKHDMKDKGAEMKEAVKEKGAEMKEGAERMGKNIKDEVTSGHFAEDAAYGLGKAGAKTVELAGKAKDTVVSMGHELKKGFQETREDHEAREDHKKS